MMDSLEVFISKAPGEKDEASIIDEAIDNSGIEDGGIRKTYTDAITLVSLARIPGAIPVIRVPKREGEIPLYAVAFVVRG